MAKNKKLEWFVYYHDFNADKITHYNVLKNGALIEYIKKHKKKCQTREEFAEAIRRELSYYFWHKSEYELIIVHRDNRIILKPFISRNKEVQLDVTDDKNFDWVCFFNWVAKKRYVKDGSVKIDIYEQVMYRIDEFVDYCLNI